MPTISIIEGCNMFKKIRRAYRKGRRGYRQYIKARRLYLKIIVLVGTLAVVLPILTKIYSKVSFLIK